MHFRAPDEHYWHLIGDELAPKGTWNKIVKDPGLRSVTMKCQRPDGRGGDLFVKLEPSTPVQFGIFVDVNDHYAEPGKTTPELVETVRREYADSLHFAKRIGEALTEIA